MSFSAHIKIALTELFYWSPFLVLCLAFLVVVLQLWKEVRD
jgi:hypothetical protein